MVSQFFQQTVSITNEGFLVLQSLMKSNKIQNPVDSKKVEHKEGIETNILPRDAQIAQKELSKSLMITALGTCCYERIKYVKSFFNC